MPDAHKNFAYSTVRTPPSPAASGPTLDVQEGDAALFPLPPFNAVVCPVDQAPLVGNAEVLRITSITTDTFHVSRQQEGSNARTILAGDQIFAGMTAKTFTDIETVVAPIGAVDMYLGTADPAGGFWVMVDGRSLARASYPDFATWAIANGLSYDTTNIHLPDMRQRFPLGAGGAYALLAAAGEAVHTLLAAESGVNGNGATGTESAAHNHTFGGQTGGESNDHQHYADSANSAAVILYNPGGLAGHGAWTAPGVPTYLGDPASLTTGRTADHSHAYSGTTSTEGQAHAHALAARNADSAHNNMPPYVVVNFIVRVK